MTDPQQIPMHIRTRAHRRRPLTGQPAAAADRQPEMPMQPLVIEAQQNDNNSRDRVADHRHVACKSNGKCVASRYLAVTHLIASHLTITSSSAGWWMTLPNECQYIPISILVDKRRDVAHVCSLLFELRMTRFHSQDTLSPPYLYHHLLRGRVSVDGTC